MFRRYLNFFLILSSIIRPSYEKQQLLSLIERYFRLKSINSCEVVVCSERDALEIITMRSPSFIRRISTDFKVPSMEFNGKVGIYIDGHCETNLKSIERHASEYSWETGFSWLIRTGRLDEAKDLFDKIPLGIFSDVAIMTDDDIVYAVKRTSTASCLEVIEIGRWDIDTGYDINTTAMSDRIDLNRSTITGGTVFSVQIYKKQNATNEMQDITFHPGIDSGNRNIYAMTVLIADLFNFRLKLVEGDKFGSLLPDGRHFDGIMGMIERREINLSLTTLLPVAVRLKAGYVTMTLQEYSLVFALKQPKRLGTFHAMILEFSPTVWVCLLAMMFTGGVVLSITQYSSSNPERFGGWIQSIASFTCQGLIMKMTKCSTRTASVTLLFSGVFILNYYAGSAVTSLLSPSQIRIRDLKGLLDSHMKLYLTDAQYLRDSEARSRILLPEVKNVLTPGEINFREFTKGVNEVRQGGRALCAEAFILYRAIDEAFFDHEKCDLTFINAAAHSSAVGFMQKNPHFRELMMRGLLRIQEHGLKQREHDRWIGGKPTCLGDTEFIHIHLEAVSIALLIHATGFILSIFAVVVEKIIQKKHERAAIRHFTWTT